MSVSPRRYVREVELTERNPQPEPYLGPAGIADRDSLVLAVARMERERSLGLRLRVGEAAEFRPGYLERVRARISPPAQPEDAAAKGQIYRIVGDKR